MTSYFRIKVKYKWDGHWTSDHLLPAPSGDEDAAGAKAIKANINGLTKDGDQCALMCLNSDKILWGIRRDGKIKTYQYSSPSTDTINEIWEKIGQSKFEPLSMFEEVGLDAALGLEH